MIPTRRALLVMLMFVGSLATGCGAGKWFWSGPPIAAGGVQIQVTQAFVEGQRFQVRTFFFNQSPQTVMVNRDGVALVLPNGRVLGRYAGPAMSRIPYIIGPGTSRPVHIEFEADNFHWRDFPAVQVNWTNAVTVNGTPVMLPPTTLTGDP